MKSYTVTIGVSHESFGGYDHNDGDETFKVKAANRKSAGNKALKMAESDGGGYSYRVKEVQNDHDEDDWVYYS